MAMMERAILVGGEAIKFGAGVGAIAGVEVTGRLGMPSAENTARPRTRWFRLQSRRRQLPLGIDENGMRAVPSPPPGYASRAPKRAARICQPGNIRHSGETEIDAVRQNGGKQGKLVVSDAPGAKMGRTHPKIRSGVHLNQQVGDRIAGSDFSTFGFSVFQRCPGTWPCAA